MRKLCDFLGSLNLMVKKICSVRLRFIDFTGYFYAFLPVWSEEPKNRTPNDSPSHSLKSQTSSDNKMSVCHPRKSAPTVNFQ